MVKTLRTAAAALQAGLDRRDLLGAAGIGLLAYGGETLYPGAGVTLAGAVLVAVAVLVR